MGYAFPKNKTTQKKQINNHKLLKEVKLKQNIFMDFPECTCTNQTECSYRRNVFFGQENEELENGSQRGQFE